MVIKEAALCQVKVIIIGVIAVIVYNINTSLNVEIHYPTCHSERPKGVKNLAVKNAISRRKRDSSALHASE